MRLNYRFMRMLVFFDLPVTTAENRREYRKFRKNLIASGFFMLQESVYCRMLINEAMAKNLISKIEGFKPSQGMICALIVTEKQFAGISFISGSCKSDVVTSDKCVVVI